MSILFMEKLKSKNVDFHIKIRAIFEHIKKIVSVNCQFGERAMSFMLFCSIFSHKQYKKRDNSVWRAFLKISYHQS